MKSFFSSLLALLAGACMMTAAPARAQTLPNGNLDTWVTRNGVEAPADWSTTDEIFPSSPPLNSVTKTSVAQSGPFAAQLQTQNVAGTAIPAILFLGQLLQGAGIASPGLPFTARPTSIQFYYQLSGAQAVTDAPSLSVLLTRRVNGNEVAIAGASYVFTAPAASYTLVTVPLQYLSTMAPDSISVFFISGLSPVVTAGTTLRIDNISFSGTGTATRDAALNAAVGVVPNPSPDGRYTISAPTEPALLSASLVVLDATGRIVHREGAAPRAAATRTLDLSGLPPGIYTLQLFTPRGLVTRKLVR
ncbi:T9SS type A sorting domain-containing protein [Hymenobacter sp.]|uniref:T9SS type A sorting domain-containing protein n=1 Tax=Hymenobacter sp. TaxID=1898978 RepID=UPI00286A0CC9|nr:T9SS type A sorting domain-containing protein [Hymenobacter sp.]